MKYVLLYESANDVAAKAPAQFAAHSERVARFHAAGTLLMIGVFANVQRDGAMGIFTSRDSAEEFALGDPFVLNGVVVSWEIREWRESLVP
jgi:uncharacterized protein